MATSASLTATATTSETANLSDWGLPGFSVSVDVYAHEIMPSFACRFRIRISLPAYCLPRLPQIPLSLSPP